jgi:hypothetical protein
MASVSLARALFPLEVSKVLQSRAQTTFAADYRDTLLLLIDVAVGGDLLAGLEALDAPTAQPSFLPTRRLAYETQVSDVRAMLAAGARRGQSQEAVVAAALTAGPHFMLALRKRPDADQILHDRISVGRALNKDIVLRDASISKLHAWFELHDARDFSVVDAGSKNQTYVNGEALQPRQAFPLQPGDVVRFGSIASVLCEAEGLWSAVHGHAR